MSKKSILVVDNYKTNGLVMQGILGSWGYKPLFAENEFQALGILERKRVDLIISDVNPWIIKNKFQVPVVIISISPSFEAQAKDLNIPFFLKPIDFNLLKTTLQKTLA